MNFDFIQQATSRELEQFKSVCNQLLSRTYVVRTLYRPGKGRVNNPDYAFLSLHYEAVQDYLGLLDWDLRKDMLIFCCSIKWISSLYWRLRWTERASMKSEANRRSGI